MDAAIPADAKDAPPGIWKTAQNAVSHSAHTHHPVYEQDEDLKRPTLTNLSIDSDQVQIGARFRPMSPDGSDGC
jgi:hypothetical protein